jgi:phosphate transport system substrate-binding protein
MRRSLVILVLAIGLMPTGNASADELVRLTGSGASFPFPIYSLWFKTYARQHDDLIVDYQAKGSGAGIRDFVNETVDFAGSDAAITAEEAAQVERGVMVLPVTAGKIVLSYNLPGLDEPLRLSRDAYAGIFLGEVTRWDDPRIAATNPGVELPDDAITVVRRADSSGTTFVFSKHLSAISSVWAERHGVGKTVVWPDSGRIIAAPKNDGVTATIKQTPGAVGYVEYAFARFAGLPMAHLENRAGRFVEPTPESGAAALAAVELPPDMIVWVSDPEGADAYPIVTYSWLLFYQRYPDAAVAGAIEGLLEYCLTEGQQAARRMGYIPLPGATAEAVLAAARQIR